MVCGGTGTCVCGMWNVVVCGTLCRYVEKVPVTRKTIVVI